MISPGVEAAFGLVRDGLVLEVEFAAAAGAITALVGASGAGKTTILNCIAGLDRPDRGRLAVGGQDVFDASRKLRMPRARRPLAHLSPAQGPPRGRSLRTLLGEAAAEAAPSLATVAELLRLEDLLAKPMTALTAGERRRAALARALVAGTRVLLLDEPLAALGAEDRAEMAGAIAALHRRLQPTILYATHDASEAARIAEDVVLLDAGRVVAAGPVAAISQSEVHHALFADAGSVVEARVSGKDLVNELIELRLGAGVLRVPAFPTSVGRTIRLRIAPASVAIVHHARRDVLGRGVLEGVLRALVPVGGDSIDAAIASGPVILWSRLSREAASTLAPGRPLVAEILEVDRLQR